MNFGLMRELQIGHKHAGVVISYVFPPLGLCIERNLLTGLFVKAKCETGAFPCG